MDSALKGKEKSSLWSEVIVSDVLPSMMNLLTLCIIYEQFHP